MSRAISAPGAVGTNLVGHHGLAGEVHEAAGRAQQRGLILVMAGHRVYNDEKMHCGLAEDSAIKGVRESLILQSHLRCFVGMNFHGGVNIRLS